MRFLELHLLEVARNQSLHVQRPTDRTFEWRRTTSYVRVVSHAAIKPCSIVQSKVLQCKKTSRVEYVGTGEESDRRRWWLSFCDVGISEKAKTNQETGLAFFLNPHSCCLRQLRTAPKQQHCYCTAASQIYVFHDWSNSLLLQFYRFVYFSLTTQTRHVEQKDQFFCQI